MLCHLMSRRVLGTMDNCPNTHSEHHGVQAPCTDHGIGMSHSNKGPSLLRMKRRCVSQTTWVFVFSIYSSTKNTNLATVEYNSHHANSINPQFGSKFFVFLNLQLKEMNKFLALIVFFIILYLTQSDCYMPDSTDVHTRKLSDKF